MNRRIASVIKRISGPGTTGIARRVPLQSFAVWRWGHGGAGRARRSCQFIVERMRFFALNHAESVRLGRGERPCYHSREIGGLGESMSEIEELRREVAELRKELEAAIHLIRWETQNRIVIERYLEILTSTRDWKPWEKNSMAGSLSGDGLAPGGCFIASHSVSGPVARWSKW